MVLLFEILISMATIFTGGMLVRFFRKRKDE